MISAQKATKKSRHCSGILVAERKRLNRLLRRPLQSDYEKDTCLPLKERR